MLILTRKLNESVIIDGRIAVKILRIDKDQVKLGIVAPTEVGVHRWEIFEAIQAGRSHKPEQQQFLIGIAKSVPSVLGDEDCPALLERLADIVE